MTVGYHLCFGAYGFWLPNDPRGSGSNYVGSKELLKFGRATKLKSRRRSVARKPHDVARRLAAKEALKYPAVRFNGVQARAVGRGFAEYARNSKLTIWACAVLPDHAHLVVARHRLDIEQVAIQLKGAATRQLLKEELHPFGALRKPNGDVPRCWGRGEWKVELDSEEEVRQRVRYVEDNPLKEGLPRQKWSFVTPFAKKT
ncbi:MAG TPA: transposase [Gemmataceae bacterium]